MTNVLVDAAVRDPPELDLKRNVAAPLSGDVADEVSAPDSAQSANGKKTAKHLLVEERSYFAVSATLETILLLADYLRIIINLPLLTTDAVGRVIEFLKSFNSRTCQVVLGAGAMRSAGLKNITAKHLGLSPRYSLSI